MPFTTPFVSCAQASTRVTRAPHTQPDPCQFPSDVRSNVPIDHEVEYTVMRNLAVSNDLDELDHKVSDVFNKTVENVLTLDHEVDHLHVVFGDVDSDIIITHDVKVCGGCIVPETIRCVYQAGHGLSIGQWIIIDQVSEEWYPVFDGGTTEDDAVAVVTVVDGPDQFCYRAIGPIVNLDYTSLVPGTTYYVTTDGNGGITTTEPADTSVPRFFAISPTEAILLPYRPLDTSTATGGKTQEVFDVDATIAATKIITLSSTPVAGSEDVYINGVLATHGATRDYTITGNVITFNSHMGLACKLVVGDLITVKYNT